MLWGIGGIILGMFGLGYTSAFLPPETFWWTGPFAVVLPLTGIGAGLVALGLLGTGLAGRRYGRTGVALVVLVAVAVRFAPLMNVSQPPAPRASDLRLLTFNVPKAHIDPTIADFVQEQDVDLIAFQETTFWAERGNRQLRHLPTPLRAVLDSTGHRFPALPGKELILQPVLARIEVDSLRMTPLPGDGTQRVTRVGFTWQGRRAVLYNVHLHSVSRTKPWRASTSEMDKSSFWRTSFADYREGALMRAEQARLIRRMIERETVPVIVAGDFNSTHHDWAYRHLADGMQDVYQLRGQIGGGTYPADGPLVRIDHVLVSEEWKAVDARILEATMSSDHRPVVVQLRWR